LISEVTTIFLYSFEDVYEPFDKFANYSYGNTFMDRLP